MKPLYKRFTIYFFLIFNFLPSYAQSPDTLWTKTCGGINDDKGFSVRQTFDGGYIIAGYTHSYGAGQEDVYLIKTDSLGDTIWTRTYGGTNSDAGYSVQQTSDSGYIIVGYTSSFGTGSEDIYLIKTDVIGDTIWTKTYGGPVSDSGYSVEQTGDGGYVIVGSTSSFGSGNNDVYLIRTDINGDTIWTKTFGGAADDYGYSVQQTTDGGYIITGVTYSFGIGNGDVYLIKTDSTGDSLWTRTYGTSENDVGYAVRQTVDGGYIIGGAGYWILLGYDFYFIKTDENGYVIWDQYNGSLNDDFAHSVQQTHDGGYIIVGNFSYELYIIRTDTVGLNYWTMIFGGVNYDCAYSIQGTRDGGYIITGITNSFGAGNFDVYLVKTTPDPVYMGEYQFSKAPAVNLQVLPNPSRGTVKIKFKIPEISAQINVRSQVMLRIYDVTGRLVKSFSLSAPFVLDWSGYDDNRNPVSSGVYLLRLEAGEENITRKLVLIR